MEAVLNSALGRTTLGNAPIRLGRVPDNHVVISDPQASSRHAEIAPGPDGTNFILTDLGSTNGTYVNGQRLAPQAPHPLRNGDVVLIGNTHLTYEVSGEAEQTVRGEAALELLKAYTQSQPAATPGEQGANPGQPSAEQIEPEANYPASLRNNPMAQASPSQSSYPTLTPMFSNIPPQSAPPTEHVPDSPQAGPTGFVPSPSHPNFSQQASPAENIPAQPSYDQKTSALPAQPGYAPTPAPFPMHQPGSHSQVEHPGSPHQPGFPPQQSGFPPQQPGFGGPPPGMPPFQAPPRKANTGVIALVVVLLVAVVGGGIFAAWFMNRSTPDKTLAAYCDAFMRNDHQGMHSLFSTQTQSKISPEQTKQGLTFLKNTSGGIKSCTFTAATEKGTTANSTVTLAHEKANLKPVESETTLAHENGTWKIENKVGAEAENTVWFMNYSTPDTTLTAYCNAFVENDAETMHGLFSKKVRLQLTPEQIKQFLSLLTLSGGGIEDCEYSDVKEKDDTATATITLTPGKADLEPAETPTKLVKEDGAWKVDEEISDDGGNTELPEL